MSEETPNMTLPTPMLPTSPSQESKLETFDTLSRSYSIPDIQQSKKSSDSFFDDYYESIRPKLDNLKNLHWTSFERLKLGFNVYNGERDRNFLPHGYGTQLYPNGDVYVGKFDNGLKNGRGSYSYSDGSEYSGYWENGKRSGVGTMRFSDGSRYQGDWENDDKHGWGKYEFANGDIYEGQFDRNSMQGYCGIYSFAKPAHLFYVGSFKNNKIHWKDCAKIGPGKLYASKNIATVDRMIYADKQTNYSAQTAVESFVEDFEDDEDLWGSEEFVTGVESV